jgi:hypothetical protein
MAVVGEIVGLILGFLEGHSSLCPALGSRAHYSERASGGKQEGRAISVGSAGSVERFA